jgi:hypothetical protein
MLIGNMPLNKLPIVKDSNAVITWFILASDGTGYASYAALLAAGKTAWPAMPDQGMFLNTATVRSEGASAADGSPFYVAPNFGPTAPGSDLVGELVSAGGVGYTYPGHIYNLWIRKTVSTDKIIAQGTY